MARPPVVEPLSPGQALHLVDDPERAALARHTAEQQVFEVAEPVTEPAPVAARPDPAPAVVRPESAPPAAEPAPVQGRWRRLWRRLTGSD